MPPSLERVLTLPAPFSFFAVLSAVVLVFKSDKLPAVSINGRIVGSLGDDTGASSSTFEALSRFDKDGTKAASSRRTRKLNVRDILLRVLMIDKSQVSNYMSIKFLALILSNIHVE